MSPPHAWLGQPLGRGGVFELFIFIIIASRVFIIIITWDHRCDSGDTWGWVCAGLWSSGMLLSPQLLSSPVFSLRSKFVLTWADVTPVSVWRPGPGPLLPGYWLDTGLLTTHGAGRVNFDSVHCQPWQWAQNTNTEIITHSQARLGYVSSTQTKAWPRLTWRQSWIMEWSIFGDHDWSLLILVWLAPPACSRCHEARKWSQEVNHGLVTIAVCNQWIKSS